MGKETGESQITTRAVEEMFIHEDAQPARKDRVDVEPGKIEQQPEEFFNQNIQAFSDPVGAGDSREGVDAAQSDAAPVRPSDGMEFDLPTAMSSSPSDDARDGEARDHRGDTARAASSGGPRGAERDSSSGSEPEPARGGEQLRGVAPSPFAETASQTDVPEAGARPAIGTVGEAPNAVGPVPNESGPDAGFDERAANSIARAPDSAEAGDQPVASAARVNMAAESLDDSFAEPVSAFLASPNGRPSAITSAGGVVEENAAPGTLVAELSAIDPDGNDGFTFGLVDDPSGLFVIDGHQIKVRDGAEIDFESDTTHDITVRVTDSAGNTFEEVVAVDVTNINEGPTDIVIGGGSVAENSGTGIVVATLSGADPDAGEAFSYDIPGGSDVFEISDGQLLVKEGAALDFESAPTQELTIRVTDSGGNTFEEVVAVDVTNINEGPTDIVIGGGSVAENSGTGIVVATLSGADPDAGEAFSYDIPGGSDVFEISDGQLLVKEGAALDFESAPTQELTIRVTDSGGNTFEEVVAVDVTNINEGPTDIVIGGGSVAENSGAGIVVATLSGADPDAGEAFSYDIPGGSDVFEISDGQLLVKEGAALDFESAPTQELTIRVTDSGGNTFEEVVAVDVTNINEGPTDIVIGGGSVAENSGAGTVVATLSGADPDAGEAFSYDIPGGSDVFEISDGQLLVKEGAALDFESAPTQELTIRVTDSGGNTFEEVVAVDVTNINEGPTDIVIGGGSVAENSGAGTVVATLSGADPDAGEAFSYDIPGGSDVFEISDGQLLVKEGAALDFESAPTQELTIRVTDSGGNTFEEVVAVDVTNINEGPTDIVIGGGSVAENSGAGTVVATLSGADPDAGEAFSYDIPGGSDVFEISDGQLLVKEGAALDFESAPTQELTIRVTDSGGNTFEEVVAVDVTNINEGPTDIVIGGGSVAENSGAGTVVATLSGADPDAGEAFSFGIVDDPSNNFEISGNEIRVKAGAEIDYETSQTHTVRLEVTDSAGNSHEEDFTISVADLYESTPGETVVGTGGEDHLVGTAGDDLLEGGRGSDVLEGGDGNDTFKVYGDAGTDQIDGGDGYDVVQGTRSNDVIRVTDNLDNLQNLEAIDGGDGYDVVQGGGGNDTLDFSNGPALSNIEEIDGGYGDDHIIGTAGDDFIEGNRGNDVLDGGDGNDTFKVYGDAGTDQIDGGDGYDVIQGTNASDVIRVTDNLDNLTSIEAIDGGAGYDVVQGGGGNDTLDFSNGPALSNIEEIDGGYGNDHIIGTAGDDFIEGNRGNDVLDGGDGNDTFKVYGDAGTDQIDGGDGYDVIQGTNASDVIRVNSNLSNLTSIEAIDGGAGYDVVQGGGGNDTLDFSNGPALSNIEEIDGGYGNDHIIGTAGDDHIEGNRGNDVLDGGDGNDTFKVYGDAGTDQIDGGDGYDVVQGTRSNDVIRVTDNLDNLQNLEAIDGGDGYDVVQGGGGNDTLDFSTAPALSNIEEIDGGYGNDHIIGTAGNDHIEGNRGNDVLDGGDGNDTFKVYGDAGTDQIDGGDGYDVIQGTNASDVIRVTDDLDNLTSIEAIDGGGGYDVVQGGGGNDTLDFSGGPALSNIEEIDGGYGDDHIIGTAGDDHIEGNRGNDVLDGGDGNDTFKVYGDAGTDQIDGGDGYDVVQGTRSNDVIRVTDNLDNLASIEAIDGGGGYDVVQGGNGNDTLDFSGGPALSNIEEIDGGYGDDHIIGTAGDDFIEGNRGNDVLDGGDGNDTFKVYGDAGTDQIDGGDGYDVIQGTNASDVIRVTDDLDNLTSIEAIDGGGGYDVVQGGGGNDTLDFSNGPALSNIEEIDGGYGDDHIIGSAGDDFIEGNRGNDVLDGGDGNDAAFGGEGNDVYAFNPFEGNDSFDGGAGWTDVIQLSASADPGADPNDPWEIRVDGEQVEYDLAANALELDPDSSGTVSLADGSELSFEGVELIVW